MRPNPEWAQQPLVDVVDILDSMRVPVKATDRATRGGDVPYYGATGQAGTIDRPLFNEPLVLLGEDGAPFLDPSKPKAYLIDGPAWVNNHAHVLRAKPGLDRRFLKYYLDAFEYRGFANGTTRLKLTQGAMKRIPVPTPPHPVQRRIVRILEDHLTSLDIASESLDRCETRGLAVEASWLSRLASPVGSEMSSIGAELVESRGGWSRSARHSVSPDQGVPYLKMNNIQRRGTLFLDGLTHVEASSEDLRKYALREGDVLFNSKNSGDLIGKTALADSRVAGATFNENIMRLRFAARLDPAFVVLWLLSPIMRRAIRSAASASTNVAAVYKHQLLEMPIWVPDKELQLRLVQEFGDLRASLERLGQATASGRRRSSTARRAVLAAAFGGKLTGRHTDADVIEELAEA